MMELFAPYIGEILQGLVGLLILVIMWGIGTLRTKITNSINMNNDLKHKEILQDVVDKAFAFAENTVSGEGKLGKEKLDKALDFATDQLAKKSIDVSKEELRGAIEQAVLKYKTEQ